MTHITKLTEIIDGRLLPSDKKLSASLLEVDIGRLTVSENTLGFDATGLATETFVSNAIASAQLGGGEVDLSGYATKADLEDYSRFDDVSTALFGMETVLNEKVADLATKDELLTKVDKIEGKGLSTEDFTTAYKTKLDVAVTSPEVSGIVETYVMEVYNPQLETSLGNALDTKLGITSPAVSATKLASPRTINGVNFDGTANITVADSTKLPTTGGTINGNLKVTGSVTLDTVLPISSGGTGATTLTDLKAALGIPQFIQITQEDYDSLGDIEKNDPLKLYLIIG